MFEERGDDKRRVKEDAEGGENGWVAQQNPCEILALLLDLRFLVQVVAVVLDRKKRYGMWSPFSRSWIENETSCMNYFLFWLAMVLATTYTPYTFQWFPR